MGRYWARRRAQSDRDTVANPLVFTVTGWGDGDEDQFPDLAWTYEGWPGDTPLNLECWQVGDPDTLLERVEGHQIHNGALEFEDNPATEGEEYYAKVYVGETLVAQTENVEGWWPT